MELFSLRPRPSLRLAVLLIFWILHKIYLSEPESEKLTHIASKLEEFARRGQMAIELVPPGLSAVGNVCRHFRLPIASLRLSGIVGEALELGAVQCSLAALSTRSRHAWLWLADALIALSALFATDYVSLGGVWVACKAVRIMQAFKEIPDEKKSLVNLLSAICKRSTRLTICWAGMDTGTFGPRTDRYGIYG